MGDLLYVSNVSLDGFVADADGDFAWSEPGGDVHRFINDLVRPVGTYLFGRRMYEVMSYWETPPAHDDPVIDDFASIWDNADKVVFSRTLLEPTTRRTRIEREFSESSVRSLKESSVSDLMIGGAELAGQGMALGVVDEIHFFVVPQVVGGGTRALPESRFRLDLLDHHRFTGGTIYLRYRVAG